MGRASLMLSLMLVGLIGSLNSYAATIEIQMKNNGKDGVMTFEPGFVVANPGDSVVFVPKDPAHNSASVLVPDGASSWKGKMDQKLTVKLDKEGVYIYKCDPHLPMGMAGIIQVGKPGNMAAAKEKVDQLSKGFAMNKDRLTKYWGQVK